MCAGWHYCSKAGNATHASWMWSQPWSVLVFPSCSCWVICRERFVLYSDVSLACRQTDFCELPSVHNSATSFDLPWQQWSVLNRFHMEQGHCGACRRKWRLTDTDLCPCGETQTMSHIVEFCPLTKLNGGLSPLHSADEDSISWLTSLLLLVCLLSTITGQPQNICSTRDFGVLVGIYLAMIIHVTIICSAAYYQLGNCIQSTTKILFRHAWITVIPCYTASLTTCCSTCSQCQTWQRRLFLVLGSETT